MIETHPFEIFVPPNAKFLILGSFAAKEALKEHQEYDPAYDWYYGTKRNQFWPILEAVYDKELRTKLNKQALFTRLGIAIGDIIYQCKRKDGSSLDSNLEIIAYNNDPIEKIVQSIPIFAIFFTSRFVERRFNKEFDEIISCHPAIERITLPSPSTRYARMSLEQKIANYTKLLPKLA